MVIPNYNTNVVFTHLVDIPRCDCVIGSAEDKSTGRKKLFLAFNHKGGVYARNGIKDTWEQIKSREESIWVRWQINRAIEDKNIPCFISQQLSVN